MCFCQLIQCYSDMFNCRVKTLKYINTMYVLCELFLHYIYGSRKFWSRPCSNGIHYEPPFSSRAPLIIFFLLPCTPCKLASTPGVDIDIIGLEAKPNRGKQQIFYWIPPPSTYTYWPMHTTKYQRCVLHYSVGRAISAVTGIACQVV